jgi:hypothetical protein
MVGVVGGRSESSLEYCEILLPKNSGKSVRARAVANNALQKNPGRIARPGSIYGPVARRLLQCDVPPHELSEAQFQGIRLSTPP